jgi:glycosyltransferase involved in cell wall biosynthesis
VNYWLLSSEYPPFFGGGIGTYCAITAKMLSEKGHRVSVFVNDASVTDIQINEENEVRVIRFGTSRTNSSAFLGHVTNISYEFAHIVKHFVEKEGKPDIIEAQEYLGIAYYLLQYKRLLYDWCRDIPILVTMHSPSFLYMEYNHVPMYRYPNFWICEMERFCLQAADRVISPSQYMLNELKKRYTVNHNNIDVIPNPFEAKWSDSAITTSESNEIVFYGKLTAQKGAFQLLHYFSQLWDQGFNRPLYLVGGQDIIYHPEGISMGDLIRTRYKNYIRQGFLKMESRVKPTEIAGRLAKAEVVVIPSNNDNLPYVVFEMMALGRIVLVSRQGGHVEVVENGIDGFVFDHNTPGTFFDQLKLILQLNQEERNRISAAAKRKVNDHFSKDVIFAKKIQVIKKMVQVKDEMQSVFPLVRNSFVSPAALEHPSIKNKLSVVVPFFNLGNFIDETITSILKCKYENLEILIVNDGSTDPFSITKLDTYRKQKSIKVIDVVNGGLGNARNIGAISAEGEYLAFLDADDTVHSEYYSRAIKVFQQYSNIHFAGCWIKYFGTSQKTWPSFQPEAPLILYHNLVNSSSLVYKRAAFIAGGKNDVNMTFQGLEDYGSVISMLNNGFGGVVLPDTLFNYRIRSDSMIRAISVSKKLHLYQHISDRHKQFYATFAADVFNLLNANGPGILQDNPSLDHHLGDRLPFGGKIAGKVISLIKRNQVARGMAYKVYKLFKK